MILLASCCGGCSTNQSGIAESPERSISSPDSLFAETVEQYHLPSANASSVARNELLELAAQGYLNILRKYPDQERWCAQALRSLGNVSAEQGNLDDAIGYYSQVAEKYPEQGWEVLQAWKTAADLLFENSRPKEALGFYQNIVDRFDHTGESQLIQTIVRRAKIRSQGEYP